MENDVKKRSWRGLGLPWNFSGGTENYQGSTSFAGIRAEMAVKSHNAWHRVVRYVGTYVSGGTLSVTVHRCRYAIQILLLLSACIVILLWKTLFL